MNRERSRAGAEFGKDAEATTSKYKGQRTTNILIIIGLALGLAAFIVISGIMNSLQSFQIDGLKNIQSFDINVKSAVLTPEDIKTFVLELSNIMTSKYLGSK